MSKLNVRGHKILSAAEKSFLLEKYHSSSVNSVSGFAREHGISASTFYGWLKSEHGVRKPAPSDRKTIRLVPEDLEQSNASENSSSRSINLKIRCGSFFEFFYHQER